MAIDNNPVFDKKYKYGYSEEVALLEDLEHEIMAAANNLDIDKILSLLSAFENTYYSELHIANQQSFDILKANVFLLIEKIRKEKELIARRQRELQEKENAYQSLIDIKNSLLKAKTISEYNKYKDKYNSWLKKYKGSFGWNYNKKIDNVKDAIETAIGPESAIDELKNMVEHANTSGGFNNDSQIKDWMNKYPLNSFHEVHKKEVQELIDKAFSLVKIADDSSFDMATIIPGFLFMSPTQAYAVNDLKKIMFSNPNDYNSILNWIYTYRDLSFTEPYRQAISTLIPVEYGLKLDNTYSIPVMTTKDLSTKQTKKLVKDTIINYFGILLCGNSFDSTKKSALHDVYTQAKVSDTLSQVSLSDESQDNLIDAKENSLLSVTYSEGNNSAEVKIEDTAVVPDINPEIVKDSVQTSSESNTVSESDIQEESQHESSPDIANIELDIVNIIASTASTNIMIEPNSLTTNETLSPSGKTDINIPVNVENTNLEEDINSSNVISRENLEDKPENEIMDSNHVLPKENLENEPENEIMDSNHVLPKENLEDEPENEIMDSNHVLPKENLEDEPENENKDSETIVLTYSQDDNIDYSNPYQLTRVDINNIEAVYSLIEPQLDINHESQEEIIEEPEESKQIPDELILSDDDDSLFKTNKIKEE